MYSIVHVQRGRRSQYLVVLGICLWVWIDCTYCDIRNRLVIVWSYVYNRCLGNNRLDAFGSYIYSLIYMWTNHNPVNTNCNWVAFLLACFLAQFLSLFISSFWPTRSYTGRESTWISNPVMTLSEFWCQGLFRPQFPSTSLQPTLPNYVKVQV